MAARRAHLCLVAWLFGGVTVAAEHSGLADISFQGFYLGGASTRVRDVSGLGINFKDFIPGVGLLTGSLEGYGAEGRLQTGENYLQLRGYSWKGYRWTFSGGDFRRPSHMVEFPFHNIFTPDIGGRGVFIEAARKDRQFEIYFGGETIQGGPRVPFRLNAPQTVLGGSAKRQFGDRLQVGVRLLRLWSSEDSVVEKVYYFPVNRDFLSSTSVSGQVLYKLTGRLKLYGEATLATSSRLDPTTVTNSAPFSTLGGVSYDSPKFTFRTNYSRQSASYLPLLAYFLGDRKGPYTEARYRPFRRFEFFASTLSTSNNLERNTAAQDFKTKSSSVGMSLVLPWKFGFSAQLTSLRFSVRLPGPGQEFRPSNNRQTTYSLNRPVRRHNLRVAARDLRLDLNGQLDRQRSYEVEDIFSFRGLMFGGSVRGQTQTSDQKRNSLFYRGSAQGRIRRFSIYSYVELGNDLVNKTVFATNTYNTIVGGVSAPLFKEWNLQSEVFRNRFISTLNPGSVFVLASQGVGLSTILTDFNQWSFFFRLTKQIRWGGVLPSEGLDQFMAREIPLTGSVDGFVTEVRMDGNRPVEGIPVSLDGGRTVLSGPDGRFLFEEVPEGRHRVAISSELPTDFDPGSKREFAVAVNPNRITRVDLDVYWLTSIEGAVTAPKDTPFDNLIIRLAGTERYTTPDSEGRFGFYNMREGDYQVVVDQTTLPPGTAIDPAKASASVSLRRDQRTEPISLELKEAKDQRPVRRVVIG